MSKLAFSNKNIPEGSSLGHFSDFNISPQKTRKQLDMESELQTKGLDTEIERMWLFKNNNPLNALTDINGNYCYPKLGVQYTRSIGYEAVADNGAIDSDFILSQDLVKATNKDISFFWYLEEPVSAGNPTIFGVINPGDSSTRTHVYYDSSSDRLGIRLLGSTFTYYTTTEMSAGFYQAKYFWNGSGYKVHLYLDGSKIWDITLSQEAGGLADYPLYIFNYNDGGIGGIATGLKLSLFGIGSAMDGNENMLSNVFSKYV